MSEQSVYPKVPEISARDEQIEQQQQRQFQADNSIDNGQQADIQAFDPDATKTQPPEFTIIWQNLTHKVDSRNWRTKLRERLFRSRDAPSVDNQTLSMGPEDNFSGSNEIIHKGERTILNGICGDVKSRQLTGILGPSGAGKSTLLHCLFQNRTAGTTGRILVDSVRKKKLKVCFIPQKDYLNEWLTVREDLVFVSKLRSAKVNMFSDNSKSNLCSQQPKTGALGTTSYAKQTHRGCSTTLIDHEENAFRVAELLGITNCLDVPIRKISGGQKKRLSVARELMSTPDILIMDEPTTGLDSLTCTKMISVLRDLAHSAPHPMAVIVTIHQPQRSVFNLFDKTYFLSNKGRAIYDDKPQNVIETLSRVANYNKPTSKHNPAAALIEVSSDRTQTHIAELMAANQQNKFNEKYDSNYIRRLMRAKNGPQNWTFCAINDQDSIYSDGSCATRALDDNTNTPAVNPTNSIQTIEETNSCHGGDTYFISRQLRDCLSSHANNNLLRSLRHIFILTHRSWLSVIRNPTMTRSRLIFHASMPLIMLLIFGSTSGVTNNCPLLGLELDINDMRKSITNGVVKKNLEETRLAMENMSFFFMVTYAFGLNIISSTASHYPLTIHMFRKETINGLYSAGPYFIGQILAELPLEIFFPSFSVMLAYSLSGQIASYLEWRMFSIVIIICLFCYTVHSLGLLLGSLFINNINVAVLLGQVGLFPHVMLSGFVRRYDKLPEWMRQVSDISFFKHALRAIMAARYGFNVCECDEDMIPEDGRPITFKAIPPRVKHVLDYMFPANQSDGIQVSKMFDTLSERFVNAQTFGSNITSCDEVKPHVMNLLCVEDYHLLRGAVILLLMIVVLRMVTFSVVRLAPYRID
jgi:ATP-binding cassette subfamily G (WHITE) protein 1